MANNIKYLKVMFGTTSGADKKLEYKIGEINVADNWNPTAIKGRNFGGFNFSTEDKIIRWLHRGDTLYDVEIPEDAEVVDIVESATPHGVFRTNKIILSNPRVVTDEMALDFYKKSNIPVRAYYKSLAGCMVRGYKNTCLEIIRDRVNNDNIELVLNEIKDFIKPKEQESNNNEEKYLEIMEYLYEIENDLFITLHIDREPYIKELTNDKVINLTGESGSGKSYFSDKYINDDNYIVIDTDIVFGDKPSNNKESVELRSIFRDKEKDYLMTNFDDCYKMILDYFKDSDKTIVIDSAQYRNIKDYSILKGTVIVMRICIDTCYNRCVNRYSKKCEENNLNYTTKDLEKYKNKKLGMYKWYKNLNKFLDNINRM